MGIFWKTPYKSLILLFLCVPFFIFVVVKC
uniref:Uncharacterized protein n=2 Tax=unclassified Caudoviricetes TaxID=2788787 RepID=A0AAU8GG23_9CAUD